MIMKMRIVLLALISFCFLSVNAADKKKNQPVNDRTQWVDLCYKIAQPVLENMSKGELQKNMQLELSPTWDGRDKRVAYMEAFGRLMAGISPWLELPDDDTAEGKQRKQIREWALKAYQNAVDPQSPDYLLWKGHQQLLVDAAYLAESFIRAPKATWGQLDDTTKERYIECFKKVRVIRPAYNNWLLFRDMVEAFLLSVGEEPDGYALTTGLNKINEWLVNLEPPMQLSEEGCVNVTTFAIEILENAQRHSVKDEEGNWYMTAFMEYRDNQYFCSLSFINTGIPIYESILSTSNPIVAKELHDYIAHHSNIDKAILSTVYALQDGSTRQNYKGSRGGIGMLRMVKFINEIGYTELVNEKPVIAIISGNVYIKFSDQYGNAVKKEDNRHYQWFNPSQDRSEKPDHNHAFLLKRTFPGTIITTRFMLDAESLSKKVKKNDNN